MRKLTRSDVDTLRKELPVLDETMQKSIYGGCGSYGGDSWNGSDSWYTMAQYETLIGSGNWTGGYVEGLGYVAKPTGVFSDSNIRFYAGSKDFYDQMQGSGFGNFVSGLADFADPTPIYGLLRLASDTETSHQISQVLGNMDGSGYASGNGFYYGVVNGVNYLYDNVGNLLSTW
ncbi:hypothetical protein FACS1894179_08450 [Bacteroidia bacterium]|nr:hypothetical protein FACS1894179_08450 [Bacteroidia bacterium]